jgi:hypothetical protein
MDDLASIRPARRYRHDARVRRIVSLYLSEETVRMLDAWARARTGGNRSAAIEKLVRVACLMPKPHTRTP